MIVLGVPFINPSTSTPPPPSTIGESVALLRTCYSALIYRAALSQEDERAILALIGSADASNALDEQPDAQDHSSRESSAAEPHADRIRRQDFPDRARLIT